MATVTGEVYRGDCLPRQVDVGVPCPSSASSNDGLIHVLAVDDSRTDRLVIERLLKISCCKVTTVDSGIRALQYLGLDGENTSVGFNDLKVNLIMTDYSMPGMTGYELLKRIKESSVFRKIPVVIMSSENILTQIDRCLEEGAEDYLVKPVKLDDVKRVTNDVKRLTNLLMRGDGVESRRVVKRKMEDDIFSFPSSSSSSEPDSPELPSDATSLIDCASKKLKLRED